MIPKAELHCHIEGTAHPALVRRLANKYAVPVEGFIDDQDRYIWHDFTSFLAAYDMAAAVFRSQQDYSDLAYDYFSRSAAEGMIYGEVFISADHAAQAGLSYKAYVEALADGITRAHEETGVEGRMIATCVRHLGPEQAVEVAKLLQKHPHPWITGFGMGGDERMFSPADFSPAFDIARDAGVELTAHAGEFGGADSVRAALDAFQIKRVGHGVRAIEDRDLVSRIVDQEAVLEVCPGSNVALGLYENWAAHPFGALRDAGVKLTLNSDDPPFFATSIGAEYDQTAKTFQLADTDLRALTVQALEAAFVDNTTRHKLMSRVLET